MSSATPCCATHVILNSKECCWYRGHQAAGRLLQEAGRALAAAPLCGPGLAGKAQRCAELPAPAALN